MPSISILSAGLKLSSSGNANAVGEVILAANPIFNSEKTAGGFTTYLGLGTTERVMQLFSRSTLQLKHLARLG